MKRLLLALLLLALPAEAQQVFSIGAPQISGNSPLPASDLWQGNASGIATAINPTSDGLGLPAATVATDLNQVGGGSTLLPFASTSGISTGQVVSGTNITAGTTVASIVATAQVTRAANGSFAGAQAVIPMSVTTAFATGQQCHDNTLSTVIGDGNVILSIQAATSITMTSNVNASSGATDSITCDPVVTLSATSTGTISAAASIKFFANATAATIAGSGTFGINGGAAILGKLFTGGAITAPTVTATTSVTTPKAFIGGATSAPTIGGVNTQTLVSAALGAGASRSASRWDNVGAPITDYIAKSRSGTLGTPGGAVVTGNDLYLLRLYGDDGSALVETARIQVSATGTVSAGQVPGEMAFWVANAAGSLVAPLIDLTGSAVSLGGLLGSESLRVVPSGPVTVGSNGATGNLGELGFNKISASGSAPTAGFAKMEWVAGTTGSSCKLISYAGTSATPVTIVDNVGTGC